MAENNRNINPNGCGIGLTVSKKYLEKLDGSISLTSKYGEGTQTAFVIPLIKDQIQSSNQYIIEAGNNSQDERISDDERPPEDFLNITIYDSIVAKSHMFVS